MSNFKVGQKVVCILEDNLHETLGLVFPGPSKDEVVTVDFIHEGYIAFEEHNEDFMWKAINFRHLVDKDYAEKLLAGITKQVQREELVLI